jgi:ATP-dependent DNA helicase RecQ
MARFGYDRLRAYGRLAQLQRKEISKLIGQLLVMGYLKSVGSQYPILRLTLAGEAALQNKTAIPLRLPYELKPGVAKPVSLDKALVEKLREWRLRIAHHEKLPAFMIFHNDVLQEIARRCPRTLEELRAIRGVGSRKLTAYGEAILAIIEEHQQKRSDT